MTLKEKFETTMVSFLIDKNQDKTMLDHFDKIADEFAIGFAHFLAEHTYSCYENGWSNDFVNKELTTKELLEIYKKEKNL